MGTETGEVVVAAGKRGLLDAALTKIGIREKPVEEMTAQEAEEERRRSWRRVEQLRADIEAANSPADRQRRFGFAAQLAEEERRYQRLAFAAERLKRPKPAPLQLTEEERKKVRADMLPQACTDAGEARRTAVHFEILAREAYRLADEARAARQPGGNAHRHAGEAHRCEQLRARWAARGDELDPPKPAVRKQPSAEARSLVEKLCAALDAAVLLNDKLLAQSAGLAFPLAFPSLRERVEWWRTAALAELDDDGPKAA